MNLSAIDLGSNSFHLLVARASASGLTKVTSAKEVLRLGAVVQAHGELPPAVFRDALDVVGVMARIARAHGSEQVVAVGTSALRDARNGGEFCALAAERHRLCVELIGGQEEGELVFRGAVSSCPGLRGRVAVVDIGGGSVEVAVGEGERLELVESLPLGFLRLQQRLRAQGIPLTAERVGEVVREHCAPLRQSLAAERPTEWLFSGGTARALGKLMVQADGISARAAGRLCDEISSAGREGLQALGVEASRLDTLGLGALVLRALVEILEVPRLRIASGGLREGVLLRELTRLEQGSAVRALPTQAELGSSNPTLRSA